MIDIAVSLVSKVNCTPLFSRLWKILEGSVSFLSQSCVGLLLACQGDIIELEVTSFNEIAVSKLSKVIRDGFSQKKWKNVAKTGQPVTYIITRVI